MLNIIFLWNLNILDLTKDAIKNMIDFMSLLIPLMTTLMLTTGCITTTSIVQPVLLFLIHLNKPIIVNIPPITYDINKKKVDLYFDQYNLPRFERQCIDSSQIHRRFYNLPQTKGLKAIVKELEIGDHKKLHNSEYDAKMTLEYVKRMCEESGLSFEQLIKKHTKGKKKVVQTV